MADISKITLNADNYNIKDSDAQVRLGGLYFVKCTKAEYDVLSERDQNTVYLITSSGSPILNVSPSAITAVSGGSEEDITIASSQDWSIASSEDWITFSQDSGEGGTYTVTATISGNSSSSRTAVITVDNGDLYESIDVQQESAISDYSRMPLTFEITSNGKITWCSNNNSSTKTIEYSKNSGEWTQITSSTAGTQINVSAGDILQFRGNNDVYSTSGTFNNNGAGGIANHIVYGNIMSLVDSTGYTATTSISANAFEELFYYDTSLTDASNLILPATTLASYCYYRMFYVCNHLTAAPVLPATTLADSCYKEMFQYCSSLETAPIICATTVATRSFQYMFRLCPSLTTAPELPATTLAQQCYAGMFTDCESLQYIKCLATDISAHNCTLNWLTGVASSGTFVKAAGMNDWTTGGNGIPEGWTVQDYQP